MRVERTSWLTPGRPLSEPSEDPAGRLAKELTVEDRKIIDWIAEQVVSRRLTAAALFLLESSKPLNFVTSQLLVVLSPLLVSFLPRIPYDRLVALLEKRDFIELLLRSVETREDELLAQRKAEKEAARAARKSDPTET